jgi:hypothetical protein
VSTKSTIAYGPDGNTHLYEELLDDTIWIETRDHPFFASSVGVRMQLPPALIDAIRSAEPNCFPHLRAKDGAQ